MSLILPQEMKLKEGRDHNNSNLVLNIWLVHKCEFDGNLVKYVICYIQRLETNGGIIFYNY